MGFLGLPEREAYAEADLESTLLEHLQAFLLELGGDFAFLRRQYRITVGGRHHFIDLLFFHRRLRCLVAIELKLGRFGYEDAGQMNFYLNYLREYVAHEDEAAPIGIILCADKDVEEVHYATGTLEHQLFVSRYLTRLPTEDQLRVCNAGGFLKTGQLLSYPGEAHNRLLLTLCHAMGVATDSFGDPDYCKRGSLSSAIR